jgi:hypothetical protein
LCLVHPDLGCLATVSRNGEIERGVWQCEAAVSGAFTCGKAVQGEVGVGAALLDSVEKARTTGDVNAVVGWVVGEVVGVLGNGYGSNGFTGGCVEDAKLRWPTAADEKTVIGIRRARRGSYRQRL